MVWTQELQTSMEFDSLGENSPEKDWESVGSDWRFDNLSRSHLESQVRVGNSNKYSDALVCCVMGSGKYNVIPGEDDEWWLVHYNLVL